MSVTFRVCTKDGGKTHFTNSRSDGCSLVQKYDDKDRIVTEVVNDVKELCRNCLKKLYVSEDPRLSNIQTYYKAAASQEGLLHLKSKCGNLKSEKTLKLSREEAVRSKKGICMSCIKHEAVEQLNATDRAVIDDQGIATNMPLVDTDLGSETQISERYEEACADNKTTLLDFLDEGFSEYNNSEVELRADVEEVSAKHDSLKEDRTCSMPEMAEPAADDVDSRCIIFYKGKSETTFILHLSSTCGNGNEMVAISPTAESSEKYRMCKNCITTNTTYYKGKSKSSYILHLSSLCGNGSGMINFVPTVHFEKYSVCLKCSKRKM